MRGSKDPLLRSDPRPPGKDPYLVKGSFQRFRKPTDQRVLAPRYKRKSRTTRTTPCDRSILIVRLSGHANYPRRRHGPWHGPRPYLDPDLVRKVSVHGPKHRSEMLNCSRSSNWGARSQRSRHFPLLLPWTEGPNHIPSLINSPVVQWKIVSHPT